MNKSLIGLIGSAVLTLIGVYLRLNAYAMAWVGPFSYSGPASETSWGRKEAAIGEVGLAFLSVGILLFVITYVHWLFTKPSDK
jgi:hypothetical protein